MPGRYYFSPVRGHQGSVMAGVADGIDRGVENFERARHTAREVRRQEQQDERRRLIEDVEMDDYLMSRGGGRGAPPKDDVTIRGPADFARPDFDMPEFNPPNRGVGMPGLELNGGLDFQPMDVTLSRQDPRFRSVGPEGFGYVMTPDALEDEQAARARGRDAQDREILAGRLGPIAGALASGDLTPDDGEEFARGVIEFSGTGVDPYSFMPSDDGPRAWAPTTEEEYLRARGRGTDGRSLDPGGGSGVDRTRPTYDQAVDILTMLYPGEYEGETSLSGEELDRMATAMASGAGTRFLPQEEDGDLPMPDPEIGKVPGARGFFQRLLPGGESGYEMTYPMAEGMDDPGMAPSRREFRERAPASEGREFAGSPQGVSEADIASIREGLSSFPQRKWREILKEENEALPPESRLTDEEIDRIVNGS